MPLRGCIPAVHAGQVAEDLAAVQVRVPDDGAQCERCLEFQDEVSQLQQRLAASGQYVTYSPGPNPGLDVERELQRWLAANPGSNAAAGFRAGWARMARLVGPRLRDWEARWWRSVRDNDRFRGRLDSSRSVTNSGGEATG
jgi:hypothetical protein